MTLKVEVLAAARVALIYDPRYFDDEDATWSLLIPIFGIDVASQLVREAAVLGGMGVTKEAIKQVLKGPVLKKLKAIMLKYFGIKVTQRRIIAKTLPVVGGLIGGTWNYFEVTGVKSRTIAFFEGDAIKTEEAAQHSTADEVPA